MKILIAGDIHLDACKIGKINPKTDLDLRVEDFIHAFDSLIQTAFEDNVDLVIVNGDLYKSRTASHLIETLVAERFRKIATKIPLWLVLGNHDFTSKGLAYDTHAYSIIEKSEPPNIKVIKEVSHINFKGKDFVVYPYYDCKLRREFKNNKEIIAFVEEKVSSFSIKKQDTLFVGHGMPEGTKIMSSCSFDLSQAEEPILPLSLLEDFEMSFFSHIHRNHFIKKNILHIGSIERTDFAEANDDKGFIIYDTNLKKTEFISTSPRAMKQIKLSVVKQPNPTQLILDEINKIANIEETLVKIEVNCTEAERQLIDTKTIKNALEKAFHFQYKNSLVFETRENELTEQITEMMSDAEALELIVNNKTNLTEEDKKEIISRGKRIFLINET